MPDIAGNHCELVNQGNGRNAKIGLRYRDPSAFQFSPERSIDARCGFIECEDRHVLPDKLIQFMQKIIRAGAAIGAIGQLADRNGGGELVPG